jgi:DNA-binding NtrC family response regulator
MKAWLLKRLGLLGMTPEPEDVEESANDEPLKVLLVDDTPTNLQVLTQTLKGLGHKLLVANNGADALAVARRSRPELVLLDVMMPGMDGFETCRQMKADPTLEGMAVIFCSALDDVASKVKGFELGAVDFVTKPYQAEEVIARVNTHLAVQQLATSLRRQNQRLAQELAVARETQDEASRRLKTTLLGQSAAIKLVRSAIDEHAKSDEPVLIYGPLACGDEAVARALHAASKRGGRAFIFLEGSQFLSSRHSVSPTGTPAADDDPLAKLELAEGGTLYIDQVQYLPASYQERLWEILDGNARAKAKGERPPHDVRFVLYSGLEEKPLPETFDPRLRQHLLQRSIKLPTLAERQSDILTIAQALLERHGRRLGRVLDGFEPEAERGLVAHSWPGNLRELEDVVVRSILACRASRIRIEPSLLEGGVTIGAYRLLDKLGVGGMGEVWRAKHALIARPAAVKLIKNREDGPPKEEVLERFRREASVTAGLCSPHTVTLYDFGVSETGAFYYVMELLKGMPLDTMVEKFGALPGSRVAHFLIGACRSLAEAHAVGLVHRDIKPANLFAARLGAEFDFLKVLDFGMVARKSDPEETRLTVQGAIYGTPDFIAPELALDSHAIDPRSDMYSLGVTAHVLLTGERLFTGDTLQVLMRHINERPPPLRDRCDAPEKLAELVMRCLEKQPNDRPTAVDMWRELEASGIARDWTTIAARAWWAKNAPSVLDDM